jgi:MFS superfamily sulfate permease-like transporter
MFRCRVQPQKANLHFLSRKVLIGFLTDAGIQVVTGQISGMLGNPGGGAGPVRKLVTDIQQLPQTHRPTLAVSVGVLATILIVRRTNEKSRRAHRGDRGDRAGRSRRLAAATPAVETRSLIQCKPAVSRLPVCN